MEARIEELEVLVKRGARQPPPMTSVRDVCHGELLDTCWFRVSEVACWSTKSARIGLSKGCLLPRRRQPPVVSHQMNNQRDRIVDKQVGLGLSHFQSS